MTLLTADSSFTARELRLSRPAVWLVALMVLCENSYTTISRRMPAETAPSSLLTPS